MTIQYCSDLHLEFPQNERYIAKYPLKPAGEILLLAGDIVPFALIDEHKDFFDYLADNFEQVYWVPGNHEYYHFDIATRHGHIHEAIRKNVFLVNNEAIQLDKVRLVFSTLWSQVPPDAYVQIQNRMADFIAIRNGRNLFTPADYNVLHDESKSFIIDALSKEATTPTIVVTHHLPTFLNYPAKYKKDVLNVAFATELFDLVERSKADYWLYGHHHVNTPAFTIGNTQLLTNQLGYIKYRENIGFKNDAVIEIN